MRIATLQLSPKLGDFEGNVQRADEILNTARATSQGASSLPGIHNWKPELLVLPELALTGYNFPSLDAIRPHLEPAGTGRSAVWARKTAQRLQCKVCVGYPEIEGEGNSEKYYNSLIVVDEQGEVVHNYRKCFLFFTDDTWAHEGNVERGFKELSFPGRAEPNISTSFGICMDINPYKFEAPFTAFEFASRVLGSKSQLVILSMAWVSTHEREAYDALQGGQDEDAFHWWLQRLSPLLRRKMQHARNLDGAGGDKRIVIVFANRTGSEPATDPEKPPTLFAGTSTILAVSQREGSEGLNVEIPLWDQLGASEEGVCFADTTAEPELVFGIA
ncbi:hypothetical protein N7470_003255 [Penicillium chermesinum]|nr:hypothetical protein N7470_003255 [Penicillium chermesinum]